MITQEERVSLLTAYADKRKNVDTEQQLRHLRELVELYPGEAAAILDERGEAV